jgi:hypothetical protein
MAQVTRMVPADRAAPPVPGRAAAPDGSRGIPLSEPTIRRRARAAEAPAIDHTAAE